VALACALGAAGPAAAQAVPGRAAPAFEALDTDGRTVRLADFRGRFVVLEWVNPGCPFVQKHYASGNLPAQQKDATARGVVWLAIDSTARDHPDYLPPAELAGWLRTHKAALSATLMDAEGRIGRAYGARTTPQMVAIDPAGVVVYAGAIDSKASTRVADIAVATPYVRQALDEVLAGRPVSVAQTAPYGCSVKYARAP
jgi:hypothetical protein